MARKTLKANMIQSLIHGVARFDTPAAAAASRAKRLTLTGDEWEAAVYVGVVPTEAMAPAVRLAVRAEQAAIIWVGSDV